MKKRNILFDLDGTLTDPGTGITRSVQHALRYYGIEETRREVLEAFIGPPLKDSFMKYYGFSPRQASEAIDYYREYFQETGIFENQVYPGIRQMLKALKDDGRILWVATSKPEPFAQRILEHFDLDGYFSCVAGASMDETRVKKGEVIAYAIERMGAERREDLVMVGDREHDILGAAENGIDSIGVLYGYGSREELEQAGAGRIAKTVWELERMLLED